MKVCQYHSLMGKPTFNIGDWVKIKSSGVLGWVSRTKVFEDYCYFYSLVDSDDVYLKSEINNINFREEDLELVSTDSPRSSSKTMLFLKGIIYRAAPGEIYDDKAPEYDCYSPDDDFKGNVCDCWVCDADGDIHPGYDRQAVPVSSERLGEILGRMPA